MTEIRIIQDILPEKGGVLDHPSPLRHMPSQIDVVHDRTERAEYDPEDNQTDDQPMEFPVQALAQADFTSIRHRAIET